MRIRIFLLFLLALAGCAEIVETQPPQPATQPTASERLVNGGFELGLEGWTPSVPEVEGVEVQPPQAGAEWARQGDQGVHFETPTGTAAISALEQVISPTGVFILDFWVRPQAGSSRIGLSADGGRGNRNVSRLVFLDAGQPSASIVFTAWDVNHVLPFEFILDEWLHVVVQIDSNAGTQTLQVDDTFWVTLVSSSGQLEPANAIVLGDRQPGTNVYTIQLTSARVTDGLNGSYDYDDIAVRALDT
jgi:hypothetical protein